MAHLTLLSLLSLFFLPPAYARAVNWDGLLDQNNGAKVYFGVKLEGPAPFERNFNETFAPASNAKLFIASAALELLGEDFRYVTRLRWQRTDATTATNVTLTGTGDPSWGMSEFGETLTSRVDAIAKALKSQGIQTIGGEIEVLAEDGRWNDISFPLGWKETDPLGCGGALAQSFTLDINCSTLKISGANKAAWQTAGVPTPVTLQISPGKTTDLKIRLHRPASGELGFIVTGTFKSGGPSQYFSVPVWNSRLWVKNLLTQALKNQGVEFRANAGGGPAEELSFHSRPLSELIRPYMKNSINVMGDAFLKTLALSRPQVRATTLLDGGLQILRDFLLESRVPDEFEFHDGSGLSRISRVTPRVMLALLEHEKTQPHFRALWRSLPVAGIDGTLMNRMRGTPAAGQLRAKTGTLDGVYNLAGYVPDGNEFVPFVMLTKTTPTYSSTARSAQDRVGAKLAGLLKASTEPQEAPFPYVPEHASPEEYD